MNPSKIYSGAFACLVLLFCGMIERTQTDDPQLLSQRRAYYPRVIRLMPDREAGRNNRSPLLASFDSENQTAVFHRSLDDGQSWEPLATLRDSTPPAICCSGLYEVPQTIGSTKAGTLFWTTSVGKGRDPRTATAMRLYQSLDQGTTWSYVTTPVQGNIGLWEAEFAIDKQGQLAMYYSTEEHRNEGFNQLLAHKLSTDGGKTWGEEVRDVAIPDRPDKKMRPGMAIVRRLPAGRYVMVYEICGMGCDVFIRFSEDGVNWGNASDPGTRIESTKNHHFAHAPSFTVLPDGQLLVVGQMLMDAAQHPVADNGRVLLLSRPGGTGPWTEVPAPVPVPTAFDNPCPNYSSQLLPSADGKRLLEIALRYDGDVCRAYYRTVAMPISH
ncbi:exo-alpha-sialidase [Spirosoma taeanense]|uniref:Exo-alpha-sialidase n=1 Tax=Spirosoma taeanense TaxID=2735870 RepID=A0A6M5Y2X6_9BACT|nr:sialidase family protein [Spirosoma taeanense]QJW88958.1 exo-alpha-sialidase [Spirosoma taeanense]